jgi:hypothetical protein
MNSIASCDVGHIGKMALADDIDLLVSRRPGLTELALAKSQISVRAHGLPAAGQFDLSAPLQGRPR